MAVQEKEFLELRDRQASLEKSVALLSQTTQQVAELQQKQQVTLGQLSSDIQAVLGAFKAREGRLDVKILAPVLTVVGGLLLFLGTLFISPLQTRVEAIGKQLDAHITAGHTDSAVRDAVIEERLKLLDKQLEKLDHAPAK